MARYFNNLAGDKECDEKVKAELEEAKINVVQVGRMDNEVSTKYIGEYNGFKFIRAWNYWMVTGNVPLQVATFMYEKYKNLDIRAFGHAGNVHPLELNNMLYSPKAVKYLNDKFKALGSKEFLKHKAEFEEEYDKIKASDKLYVDVYHIDTQEGLNTFIRVIKKNRLHTKMR